MRVVISLSEVEMIKYLKKNKVGVSGNVIWNLSMNEMFSLETIDMRIMRRLIIVCAVR